MVHNNDVGDASKEPQMTAAAITVHYSLSFKKLCMVTVACPFFALVICFITAYIYQYDDIHETHCCVYNIVPSISAITGVSPQRYLWRASVAVHLGPRYIIAAAYRAYQVNCINDKASAKLQKQARLWLDAAFWLNVVEVTALGGVTYISNVENYPVHEKLFITFMVTSLLHMVACIESLKSIAVTNDNLDNVEKELRYKKTLFVVSIAFTVGMIGFFLKHRLLCHEMAFSWFAICEYIVATANMAFHLTLIYNFPTEHLVVAKGLAMIPQQLKNEKTQ
ncbi:PREDICTED: post-GPI attachment to proteins factor 2-like [Nicrophorus vespilloides]|uniref:Post-GPI attachment to proteins factor 2-like n=1 Tax=Nicrophorus vespilloides TaxID=110193 RepID=A0ABM1NCP2_NICVS|nr:PREDICTED: post-GPI attachment to proteins factor 2-like [Nicrophorus vespilloides]